MTDYVRDASKLEDVIRLAPTADRLHDNVAYTRRCLRRFELLLTPLPTSG